MEYNKRKITLTEKESLVLKLIAGGYKDEEISEQLGISKIYIRSNIVSNMLKKTGLTNRVSLVYWAVQNKII
jgi:DNA-binding NarL/FixJ family response regulator